MVLYIKYDDKINKSSDIDDVGIDDDHFKFKMNIKIIASQMLNMEYNKKIFDTNADLIQIPDSNKFNFYTYKNTEFDINVNYGVVLLYLPKKAHNYDSVRYLKHYTELLELSYLQNLKSSRPVSYKSLKSTQYTVIEKSFSNFTKRYIYSKNIKKDIKCTFIWRVVLTNTTCSELYIEELCVMRMDATYLYRSISTIIFDMDQVFTMHNNTKQLNYPAITQYKKYQTGNLFNSPIYISDIFGIYYEVVKHYNTKEKYQNIPSHTFHVCDELISYKNFEELKIRETKDFNVDWNVRIDVNDALFTSSGLNNDLYNMCYISKTPLFDEIYALEITPNDSNLSVYHILIAPHLLHKQYNIGCVSDTSFIKYFDHNVKNCKISKIYKTKFPRTVYNVIHAIPNNKMCDVKKNILCTIEKNGIVSRFYEKGYNNYLYMSYDPELNKIFLGFVNLSASILQNFKNTNTILYNIRIWN